ncbi:MAG: FHA domain-containing protein, partial [Acidobacteriota bacterium]|nr:FHA domain-containing protein [Acidobacteriota bacterium]
MTEIHLNFIDEYGETRRVSVSDEIFTVGRTPENDLCIADHRLSREHLRIEFYADKYYASDANSSNGTTLNGAPLKSSTALKNGDRLNLGGAVEIKIETALEKDFSQPSSAAEDQSAPSRISANSPNAAASKPISTNSPNASTRAKFLGIPTVVFWFAPAFGLLILFAIGGLLWAFSGKSDKKEVVQNDDIPTYTPRTRPAKTDDSGDATPIPKTSDSPANSSGGNSASPASNDSPPLSKTSGDVEKVEQNASLFLRRIAQSDARAFLTGKQAEIVSAKISQFKGSGALAENFKAVKKNAAQFDTLAKSKNLKPQFLAAAALAKIGNTRGDPLAVANQMLPVLSDLKITLDNKLADDNLLIIASFDRGAAGNPRSLQSTLEAISKQTQGVSPREIRTIWFL